jgi:hypothetical protein
VGTATELSFRKKRNNAGKINLHIRVRIQNKKGYVGDQIQASQNGDKIGEQRQTAMHRIGSRQTPVPTEQNTENSCVPITTNHGRKRYLRNMRTQRGRKT